VFSELAALYYQEHGHASVADGADMAA